MDPWKTRFDESTRGRLIALLRRSDQTVDEMAQALGVTDNAVRAQLASLERDGLVRQRGLRRSASKPSYVYALAPDFEPALSRAYLPLLQRLLRELSGRMADAELAELLREVGRRWAAELGPLSGDLESRLAAASTLLNALGGVTEVEDAQGRASIRGLSCPLSVLVRENPAACLAIESLLSALVGTRIRECCDRSGERVRCCFAVEEPAGGASR